MQKVWVNNIPCNKNLNDLSNFYNDYDNLKNFLFKALNYTGIFNNIEENKKILLKPNWVYHNINQYDEICLTTHPNFILIVLEYVLQLKPSSVVIGDSPVQSCKWDFMHSANFKNRINKLQEINNIPIQIVDFRNEKWEEKKELQKNCRKKSEYVLYDLASDSWLEPLSVQQKKFRVGDYNPRETDKNHNIGTHKYLIAKEVIDADIVINLPKLKTHQKAGITNGLKNYVGTIGEKAYLAHHSSNLSKTGGDCYPGNNFFRKKAEFISELSYIYKDSLFYYPLVYLSALIWKFAPRSNYAGLNGAWYGNDTVWRMVLDINKIISFGNLNGEITEKPQRKIITISDAIIAGQGNGPLKPDPLAMGMVAIAENDLFLDYIMAQFMGFDSQKIPLLKAFNCKSEYQIIYDNLEINESNIKKYAVKTIPSKGWLGNIESN